ncbi:MAG: glycosyltransferase family 4 protein [Parcubacteria group bacterium]|nr:glycosyltransferase family 4 protein [Parcubacteria group bacterium]
MKILQIIHCFPPESMTGSEIYTYNLCKELSKNHKVTVFYRINNANEREYKVIKDKHNGFDIYKINNTLKNYDSLEKIYKNKDIEGKFLEALDELKPDIIHIHHLLFLSTGIIDEIEKRNIPIVFTLHDYWLVCARGQLLRADLEICKNPLHANCLYCLARGLNLRNLLKKLLRFSFRSRLIKRFGIDMEKINRSVNLFIAPSKFLQNRFIEFGISPEKIIYSDCGMDLNLFRDIEKTRSDKIRFGFIGTLMPSKGVHVAIKAFNGLKGDKTILKIYGKSPMNNGIFDYFCKIKRMSAGNANIKFMGQFDNKNVAEIFKEIDVLVFSSIWQENSPLVLHEAILTKTAIIASDAGGVGELVKNNENSLLFKRRDMRDLCDKMKLFVEKYEDLKDIRTKNVIRMKSIKENCFELEKIYENLKG